MNSLRIAFAGDRDISVWVLKFILEQGITPQALLVSDVKHATHADELVTLCNHLPDPLIMRGSAFRNPKNLIALKAQSLDYIIGIHFPYIVPETVLSIPKFGVLNLHPAYLPFNRGWHTPSWAILEETPVGATLHFMNSEIDKGDIVLQRQLDISPGDTANSLYQRIKLLEFEVFKKAWPHIIGNTYQRLKQSSSVGTSHLREDLLKEKIQRINLAESIEAGKLIKKLRALTTNQINEAAYYEVEGRRFRIQLIISEDGDGQF